MDVGTATSLNAYSYLAAVQGGGQAAPAPLSVQPAAAQTSANAGLQAITGGLDTNSATALLASLGSGQTSAATGSPTQAVAAYQSQQAYPVSAPSTQASPSSTPTSTVADTSGQPPAVPSSVPTASQDPATTAYLQQGVQALLNPAAMSLLA
jgi:hypothetical protein